MILQAIHPPFSGSCPAGHAQVRVAELLVTTNGDGQVQFPLAKVNVLLTHVAQVSATEQEAQ